MSYILLSEYSSAARGDDKGVLRSEICDNLAFPVTEILLGMRCKVIGNCSLLLGHKHLVRIIKLPAEALCNELTDSCLAASRHTDKHNVKLFFIYFGKDFIGF